MIEFLGLNRKQEQLVQEKTFSDLAGPKQASSELPRSDTDLMR
jgi:hypothetical protein